MNKAICHICKNEYKSGGMTRHIKTCLKRNTGATESEVGNENVTYLLKVQDKSLFEYVLYLLVDSCVSLAELDEYLREIWLECCGHLSSFYIDDEFYESHPEDHYEEDLNHEVGSLFYDGLDFEYTYDYGSSTELVLKVLGVFKSVYDMKGIHLISRNIPSSTCKLPNSPRAGVCGYKGPAEDIMFKKHIAIKNNAKKEPEKRKGNVIDLLEHIANRDGENNKDNSQITDPHFEERYIHKYYDNYMKMDFLISCNEIKENTFSNLLSYYRKHELDEIKKFYDIKGTYKKDELIQVIKEYILENLEEILETIEFVQYEFLGNIVNERERSWIYDETEYNHFKGIFKMGLLFLSCVDKKNHICEFIVPDEVLSKMKKLSKNSLFLANRAFTDRVNHLVYSLFYYLGVIRYMDLMKQVCRLVDQEPIDFMTRFFRIFKCMKVSGIIKQEDVGAMVVYYVLAENPENIVMSKEWQTSQYPEITSDMIPDNTDDGFLSLALYNPFLRLIYKIYTDEDSYEAHDDEEEEYIALEEAEELILLTAKSAVNAPPSTSVDKFLKIMGFQNTSMPIEQKQIFKKVLDSVPNYWLKGRAVGGKVIYVNDEMWQQMQQELVQTSIKKPGKNNKCPCGSGKKYKHCCGK